MPEFSRVLRDSRITVGFEDKHPPASV